MEKENEPLTESCFYILLCLYKGHNHGYGIMQQSAVMTNGRVKIGAGTMYGAFSNLRKKNYIIEHGEDDRRKSYALTDVGREVLRKELERLKELVANAETIIN